MTAAAILAAPPGSPVLRLPPPGREPDRDILGIFGIPAGQARAAALAGIPRALLDTFFAPAGDGSALSRSGAYYDPGAVIASGAVPALWQALRTAARHDGDLPAVTLGLTENLLNLYAAAAFAAFEHATANPADAGAARRADTLTGTATRLAGELAGIRAPWEELPPAPAPEPAGNLRAFREFDSPAKIRDELAWILDGIAGPGSGITALVFPLYGSMTLALTARAATALLAPGLSVHMIRLGFHDQAGHKFLAPDGTVRASLTGPPAHRERLAEACRGSMVLAADDNAGYGTTLRAARRLIAQHGGQPVTRSAETAWHLYHRSGRHDISDGIDLPGLRPNLHHLLQHQLTGHLLRGDTAGYLAHPARHVRHALTEQMTAARLLAAAAGTWRPRQLSAMTRELAYAHLHWNEPGIPPPPGSGTRPA